MWHWNVVCLFAVMMIVVSPSVESSALQPTSVGRSNNILSAPPPPKTTSSHTPCEQTRYRLYPNVLEKRPTIPSPYVTAGGVEVLTAVLKNGKYVCIPVTIENGKPLHYSHRVPSVYGKDQQFHVDNGDFPTLARTGLHSKAELDNKDMITGMPIDVITYIGRSGRFSEAGFMAGNEDIISVLKGDDDLVRKLGLTHPKMARPLFHVWNTMLKEI